MPEDARHSPSADDSWRLALTLAERLAAIGRTAHHKPKRSRSRSKRVHWRDERSADIARV